MSLGTELLALEAATFEVIDSIDPSMDMPFEAICSSSCSTSSCCSCSTSSCCSCSTSCS